MISLKLPLRTLPFILLSLIAIILYFMAPVEYKYEYDLYCGIQYVFSAFLFLKMKKKKNYFDFDTIFLIGFFCVFFIYPIFLYPVNPHYFAIFTYSFDQDIISRCTALALVGAQLYMAGGMFFAPSKKDNETSVRVEFLPDRFIILFTIILFSAFLMLGGYTYYKNLYSSGGSQQDSANALFAYAHKLFTAFLAVSITLEFNKQLYYDKDKISWKKINKTFVFFICFYIPLLLSTGSRGNSMETVLMILGLGSLFYYPIGFKKLLILVCVGSFAMFLIAMTRAGGGSFSINGVFDIFMDLIINNRNTFVAVDYVEKNGISYGVNMLGHILHAIPFSQGIIFTLLDIDPNLTNSATLITVETLGQDPDWGLGTNIIADLYLAFGLGGVIVFMFILGYIISKVQYMASSKHNIYYIMVYTVFMSMTMYSVRAEYFFYLNLIVWSLIIINLLRGVMKWYLQEKSI